MAELLIGSPPTLSNQTPPSELDQMLAIARKFDVAGREALDVAGRAERNRSLGRAGEERVIAHEQTTLTGAGRFDLAKQVKWVSEEEGDGDTHAVDYRRQPSWRGADSGRTGDRFIIPAITPPMRSAAASTSRSLTCA